MREIEVRAPRHPEPLHQSPARLVGRHRERHDAIDVEIGPSPIEHCLGGFSGIALSPGILAQAPADFDIAVNGPVEIVADP